MKIKRVCSLLFLILLLSAVTSFGDTVQAANSETERTDINIDINKEDKEVGLRRLEIIDKMLSQEMVDRKMNIVHRIENDYNEKAREIINSIIPPIFDNKVFTHIEVNFFSPEFESQVTASQKVHLSFIVKKAGFDRWATSYSSTEQALNSMKQLLSDALKIPLSNISGVVVN